MVVLILLAGCQSSESGRRRSFGDRFAERLGRIKDRSTDLVVEDFENGLGDLSNLVRATPEELERELTNVRDIQDRSVDLVSDEFDRTGRAPRGAVNLLANEGERAATFTTRIRNPKPLRLDPETEITHFTEAIRSTPRILHLTRVPFADPYDPGRLVDVEPTGRPPVLLQRILWRLPP
ncbi:MAG: hypothetical protein AAF196_18805 [Planctomycetota bacterium]